MVSEDLRSLARRTMSECATSRRSRASSLVLEPKVAGVRGVVPAGVPPISSIPRPLEARCTFNKTKIELSLIFFVAGGVGKVGLSSS